MADNRIPPSAQWDGPTNFSDDLRGVLQALRRHLWRFVAVFLLVTALAAGFLYLAVPLYTGTATIILDPRKEVVTNSPEVLANVSDDSSVIDTQVQLIQSRAVVGKAVDDLTAQYPALRMHWPRRFIWQEPDNISMPSSAGPAASREQVIDLLLGQLDVDRVGLTSALNVNYKDDDPERAAIVTNAIANAYIGYDSELKQRATRDADKWLQRRVSELKAQYETAQANLDAYRSRTGLMQAKGSTSTESRLTGLESGLTEAEQSLSDAQSKLSTYRSTLETAGAAEAAKIVSSATMQQLRSQYVTLLDQRAQLSSSIGPNFPQMLELNQQIKGLSEQMAAEANRTIGELKNDVAVAQSKANALTRIRDESRKQLVSDNAASVKLSQLQSDVDSLRQMYGDTLTRLQQVNAQVSQVDVNAAVVSPATIPRSPSFPKIKLVLVAAIGGGIALGALAVVLAHLFDPVLLRPQDLERRTRVPVLALVPRLRRRDLRVRGKRVPMTAIICEKPLSLFAESFRNLRVAVQQAAGSSQSVVVQLTSGGFREGKTTSAIAFAQAAAMDGRRVLLIDADVRTRSLTRSLGITVELGLIELLRGKAQLRDVILSGGEDRRPHVLPLSTAEPGPHDRFSSQIFEDMLNAVRRGFDFIVIDSGPVLAVADSLAMTRKVDAVVLVTRWATTPLEIVLKSIEEIGRAGGRVTGMLLTEVNLKTVTRQRFGRAYYPAMLEYYH